MHSQTADEGIVHGIEIDLRSGNWQQRQYDVFPREVAIDPTGRFFAALEISLQGDCAVVAIGCIKIFDLETGSLLAAIPHDLEILQMYFSERGDYLIVETRHSVSVLETESWSEVKEIRKPRSQQLSVCGSALSPDSKILATVADGLTVELYSFPELVVIDSISIRALKNPYSKERYPGWSEPGCLTVLNNRLILETNTVVHSIACCSKPLSAKIATEIRRISCTPLKHLTQEQGRLVDRASLTPFLAPPQGRWLRALNNILSMQRNPGDL